MCKTEFLIFFRCATLLLVLFGCDSVVFGAFVSEVSRISRLASPIPKTYVVAVGIGDYNHPKVPRLLTPPNDATLVYQTMNNIGHSGHLLVDAYATRENIMSVLQQIKEEKGEEDQVLFFWTGVSDYDSINADLIIFTYSTQESSKNESETPPVLSVVNDILPIFSEQDKLVFIADGCHIGDAMINKISAKYPFFSVFGSSKRDEVALELPASGTNPFARYLSEALSKGVPDYDEDGRNSLEEFYVALYPKLVSLPEFQGRQHPSLAGERTHRIYLRPAPPTIQELPRVNQESSKRYYKIEVEEALAKELASWTSFSIDDSEESIDMHLEGNSILLPVEHTTLGPGLHILEGLKKRIVIWREKNRLRQFSQPYTESHAVLVAIDLYNQDRVGFRPLTGMVDRAKELASALTSLGFAKENIHELYDSNATSAGIEQTLRLFWQGGKHSSADRLLFYFGGHGTVNDGQGLLVTHDYNPERPTLSSVGMLDLNGLQARNLAPHHVLFVLDTCFSGLALKLGDDKEKANEEFRKLAIIRSEVENRARNLLVAGTDSQEALWKNGGIFTKALIRALSGLGDQNNDGLIQFDELTGFVRGEVTFQAAQTGFRQDPVGSRLNAYGSGGIIFMRQR